MTIILKVIKKTKWLLITALFLLYLFIYIVVSISISLQLSFSESKYTDRYGNQRKYGSGFGDMMTGILFPFNIKEMEDTHYKNKVKGNIMNKYNQIFFSLFEWLRNL
jgi:hypothetical protein